MAPNNQNDPTAYNAICVSICVLSPNWVEEGRENAGEHTQGPPTKTIEGKASGKSPSNGTGGWGT